jgi:hypothetical protein
MQHTKSINYFKFYHSLTYKIKSVRHCSSFVDIFLFPGGKAGFVPNALLIFKSEMKTGDYHDEINTGDFTRYKYFLS